MNSKKFLIFVFAFLFLFSMLANVSAFNFADGTLAHYYKLDEAAANGGNVLDQMYVNNGTNNGLTNTSGIILSGYSSTGTTPTKNISLGSSFSNVIYGSNTFTVNAWLYGALGFTASQPFISDLSLMHLNFCSKLQPRQFFLYKYFLNFGLNLHQEPKHEFGLICFPPKSLIAQMSRLNKMKYLLH